MLHTDPVSKSTGIVTKMLLKFNWGRYELSGRSKTKTKAPPKTKIDTKM